MYPTQEHDILPDVLGGEFTTGMSAGEFTEGSYFHEVRC